MAIDGSLNFDTKIDTRGFKKDVINLNSQLKSLTSMALKLGAALGVAFGIKQLIDFSKSSIELASDVTEVQNVVDTAFGDMAYKMEQFADTAVETYGISKLMAKQTGSSYMAMAMGMDFANETAADMAITLTALSADMASFYNMSQEEVKTALSSVYTGETETLKRYGILITEVNLQEFARQQGITKSITAMSQQEKVMLRYNYVLNATTLAQGDFAKTSGSWANQTHMLSEKWKEFSSTVGTALINVLLPGVKALNNAMSALISVSNKLMTSLGFEAMATAATSATDAQEALTSAIEDTTSASENQLAGFDKINKLSDSSSSSDSSASSSITTTIPTTSTDAGTASTNKYAQAIENLGSRFRELSNDLKPLTTFTATGLKDFWNNFLKPLGSWGLGEGLPRLKDIFVSMTNNVDWGKLNSSLANLWTALERTAEYKATALLDFVDNCLRPIAEWTLGEGLPHLINSIADMHNSINWDEILNGLNGLWDSIVPFAINVGEGLLWFYDNVLSPLSTWIMNDALPVFLDLLADVIDGISSVCKTAAPVLEDLWDNFLAPLAGWAADLALSAISGIGDAFKNLCESVDEKDVKVMLDLAGAIGAVWLAIKGKSVLNGLETSIASAKKSFNGLKTTLSKPIMSTTDATTGATIAGAGFATTFCAAVAAGLAGWSIGSAIYDAWGEEIDSVMYPVYDAVVIGCQAIGAFFTETIPSAWNWLMEQMYSLYDGIVNIFNNLSAMISDVWTAIVQFFKDAWEKIKKIWSVVTTFFSGIWLGIKKVFSDVGSWFSNLFSTAWNGIKTAFSAVGTFFNSVWHAIKKPFDGIATWFKDTFQKAWSGVKAVFSTGGKIFSGIKEGISSVFKTVVNGIITGINKVISVPFDAINSAIGWVRDLSIAGFTPFDGLSTITVPQIPKLATGTVVPANYGEFAAILGDNKRETEVVSPLSTIKQAVAEVMGNNGNGQTIVLQVDLDGKTVYKSVVDTNKSETRRTGVNALAI